MEGFGEVMLPLFERCERELEAARTRSSAVERARRIAEAARERDEQVARWIELTEAQAAEAGLFSQVAKKVDRLNREGAYRPEGGINAAARELGMPKDSAYRATQVASLPEAAP